MLHTAAIALALRIAAHVVDLAARVDRVPHRRRQILIRIGEHRARHDAILQALIDEHGEPLVVGAYVIDSDEWAPRVRRAHYVGE